jgi:starch-binding outer membrane protein, SusD/RagB family
VDHSYAGVTWTGYYMNKIWGGTSPKNPITLPYTCPMIRLGELYLNYAEAANEAYGPNTAAPGATMTAVDAINKIRGRWTAAQLAPVQAQYSTSTAVFRKRIKNERNVELCFEGHYFYDIRRWRDADVTMNTPELGMVPEKVPVSATYPTGFKYTRYPLTDDRQCRWYEAKYYLPFTSADYYKMKKFDPGQVW